VPDERRYKRRASEDRREELKLLEPGFGDHYTYHDVYLKSGRRTVEEMLQEEVRLREQAVRLRAPCHRQDPLAAPAGAAVAGSRPSLGLDLGRKSLGLESGADLREAIRAWRPSESREKQRGEKPETPMTPATTASNPRSRGGFGLDLDDLAVEQVFDLSCQDDMFELIHGELPQTQPSPFAPSHALLSNTEALLVLPKLEEVEEQVAFSAGEGRRVSSNRRRRQTGAGGEASPRRLLRSRTELPGQDQGLELPRGSSRDSEGLTTPRGSAPQRRPNRSNTAPDKPVRLSAVTGFSPLLPE